MKQAWYRDCLLHEAAQPLAFVGRFKGMRVGAATVAEDIRSTPGLELPGSATQRAETLYAYLASKTEASGVLVFRSGVVGNGTQRPLSASVFRGFVVSGDLAPVIFINGADTPAAWAFTLMHELAHLWLGESGV